MSQARRSGRATIERSAWDVERLTLPQSSTADTTTATTTATTTTTTATATSTAANTAAPSAGGESSSSTTAGAPIVEDDPFRSMSAEEINKIQNILSTTEEGQKILELHDHYGTPGSSGVKDARSDLPETEGDRKAETESDEEVVAELSPNLDLLTHTTGDDIVVAVLDDEELLQAFPGAVKSHLSVSDDFAEPITEADANKSQSKAEDESEEDSKGPVRRSTRVQENEQKALADKIRQENQKKLQKVVETTPKTYNMRHRSGAQKDFVREKLSIRPRGGRGGSQKASPRPEVAESAVEDDSSEEVVTNVKDSIRTRRRVRGAAAASRAARGRRGGSTRAASVSPTPSQQATPTRSMSPAPSLSPAASSVVTTPVSDAAPPILDSPIRLSADSGSGAESKKAPLKRGMARRSRGRGRGMGNTRIPVPNVDVIIDVSEPEPVIIEQKVLSETTKQKDTVPSGTKDVTRDSDASDYSSDDDIPLTRLKVAELQPSQIKSNTKQRTGSKATATSQKTQPRVELPEVGHSDEEGSDASKAPLESDSDEEDVYCVCRKPYNNRFMIRCDYCGEWFHGTCVAVTKKMGREMEEKDQKWKCPACKREKWALHLVKEEQTSFVKREKPWKASKLKVEEGATVRQRKSNTSRHETSQDASIGNKTSVDGDNSSSGTTKQNNSVIEEDKKDESVLEEAQGESVMETEQEDVTIKEEQENIVEEKKNECSSMESEKKAAENSTAPKVEDMEDTKKTTVTSDDNSDDEPLLDKLKRKEGKLVAGSINKGMKKEQKTASKERKSVHKKVVKSKEIIEESSSDSDDDGSVSVNEKIETDKNIIKENEDEKEKISVENKHEMDVDRKAVNDNEVERTNEMNNVEKKVEQDVIKLEVMENEESKEVKTEEKKKQQESQNLPQEQRAISEEEEEEIPKPKAEKATKKKKTHKEKEKEKSLGGVSTERPQKELKKKKKSEDDSKKVQRTKMKCITSGCIGRTIVNSVYCSETCLRKHCNESLKLLEKANKRLAAPGSEDASGSSSSSGGSTAPDRVMVIEQTTGKLLSGNTAPTPRQLLSFLLKHPSFQVVQPSSAAPRLEQKRVDEKEKERREQKYKEIEKKEKMRRNEMNRERMMKEGRSKSQHDVARVPGGGGRMDPREGMQGGEGPDYSYGRGGSMDSRSHHHGDTSRGRAGGSIPSLMSQRTGAPLAGGSAAAGVHPDPLRINVRKNLKLALEERAKEDDDIMLSSGEIKQIAMSIEEEMYRYCGSTDQIYKAKYRCIVENMRDTSNTVLYKKILSTELRASRLARMTLDQIGYNPHKRESHRSHHHHDSGSSSSGNQREHHHNTHRQSLPIPSPADYLSSVITDTTSQHKTGHVFDLNCKICTGKQNPEEDGAKTEANKQQREQLGGSKEPQTEVEHTAPQHEEQGGSAASAGSTGIGGSAAGSRGKERDSLFSTFDSSSFSSDQQHPQQDLSSTSPAKKGGIKRKIDIKTLLAAPRYRKLDEGNRPAVEAEKPAVDNTATQQSVAGGVRPLGLSRDPRLRGDPRVDPRLDPHMADPRMDPRTDPRLAAPATQHIPVPQLPSSTHQYTPIPNTPSYTETQMEAGDEGNGEEQMEEQSPASTSSPVAPPMEPLASPKSPSPTRIPVGPPVWKGFLGMQDMDKFFCVAYTVGGNTVKLNLQLPESIQMCGRIAPSQVYDYVKKIGSSSTREVSVVRLHVLSTDDQDNYDQLYSYLNSRNRAGVGGHLGTLVKDMYILPLPSDKALHRHLAAVHGPGLPESHPNLLIAVIIRPRVSTKNKHKQEDEAATATVSDSQGHVDPLAMRSSTATRIDPRLTRYNPDGPVTAQLHAHANTDDTSKEQQNTTEQPSTTGTTQSQKPPTTTATAAGSGTKSSSSIAMAAMLDAAKQHIKQRMADQQLLKQQDISSQPAVQAHTTVQQVQQSRDPRIRRAQAAQQQAAPPVDAVAGVTKHVPQETGITDVTMLGLTPHGAPPPATGSGMQKKHPSTSVENAIQKELNADLAKQEDVSTEEEKIEDAEEEEEEEEEAYEPGDILDLESGAAVDHETASSTSDDEPEISKTGNTTSGSSVATTSGAATAAGTTISVPNLFNTLTSLLPGVDAANLLGQKAPAGASTIPPSGAPPVGVLPPPNVQLPQTIAPSQGLQAPLRGVPAPQGVPAPPRGVAAPPRGVLPPPRGVLPPPRGVLPPPRSVLPPPRGVLPPPSMAPPVQLTSTAGKPQHIPQVSASSGNLKPMSSIVPPPGTRTSVDFEALWTAISAVEKNKAKRMTAMYGAFSAATTSNSEQDKRLYFDQLSAYMMDKDARKETSTPATTAATTAPVKSEAPTAGGSFFEALNVLSAMKRGGNQQQQAKPPVHTNKMTPPPVPPIGLLSTAVPRGVAPVTTLSSIAPANVPILGIPIPIATTASGTTTDSSRHDNSSTVITASSSSSGSNVVVISTAATTDKSHVHATADPSVIQQVSQLMSNLSSSEEEDNDEDEMFIASDDEVQLVIDTDSGVSAGRGGASGSGSDSHTPQRHPYTLTKPTAPTALVSVSATSTSAPQHHPQRQGEGKETPLESGGDSSIDFDPHDVLEEVLSKQPLPDGSALYSEDDDDNTETNPIELSSSEETTYDPSPYTTATKSKEVPMWNPKSMRQQQRKASPPPPSGGTITDSDSTTKAPKSSGNNAIPGLGSWDVVEPAATQPKTQPSETTSSADTSTNATGSGKGFKMTFKSLSSATTANIVGAVAATTVINDGSDRDDNSVDSTIQPDETAVDVDNATQDVDTATAATSSPELIDLVQANDEASISEIPLPDASVPTTTATSAVNASKASSVSDGKTEEGTAEDGEITSDTEAGRHRRRNRRSSRHRHSRSRSKSKKRSKSRSRSRSRSRWRRDRRRKSKSPHRSSRRDGGRWRDRSRDRSRDRGRYRRSSRSRSRGRNRRYSRSPSRGRGGRRHSRSRSRDRKSTRRRSRSRDRERDRRDRRDDKREKKSVDKPVKQEPDQKQEAGTAEEKSKSESENPMFTASGFTSVDVNESIGARLHSMSATSSEAPPANAALLSDPTAKLLPRDAPHPTQPAIEPSSQLHIIPQRDRAVAPTEPPFSQRPPRPTGPPPGFGVPPTRPLSTTDPNTTSQPQAYPARIPPPVVPPSLRLYTPGDFRPSTPPNTIASQDAPRRKVPLLGDAPPAHLPRAMHSTEICASTPNALEQFKQQLHVQMCIPPADKPRGAEQVAASNVTASEIQPLLDAIINKNAESTQPRQIQQQQNTDRSKRSRWSLAEDKGPSTPTSSRHDVEQYDPLKPAFSESSKETSQTASTLHEASQRKVSSGSSPLYEPMSPELNKQQQYDFKEKDRHTVGQGYDFELDRSRSNWQTREARRTPGIDLYGDPNERRLTLRQPPELPTVPQQSEGTWQRDSPKQPGRDAADAPRYRNSPRHREEIRWDGPRRDEPRRGQPRRSNQRWDDYRLNDQDRTRNDDQCVDDQDHGAQRRDGQRYREDRRLDRGADEVLRRDFHRMDPQQRGDQSQGNPMCDQDIRQHRDSDDLTGVHGDRKRCDKLPAQEDRSSMEQPQLEDREYDGVPAKRWKPDDGIRPTRPSIPARFAMPPSSSTSSGAGFERRMPAPLVRPQMPRPARPQVPVEPLISNETQAHNTGKPMDRLTEGIEQLISNMPEHLRGHQDSAPTQRPAPLFGGPRMSGPPSADIDNPYSSGPSLEAGPPIDRPRQMGPRPGGPRPGPPPRPGGPDFMGARGPRPQMHDGRFPGPSQRPPLGGPGGPRPLMRGPRPGVPPGMRGPPPDMMNRPGFRPRFPPGGGRPRAPRF